MNKKILFGMLVIGLISALAGAGMYAYFNDTETSIGNTFQAGTLNLKVGDDDPTTWKITVTDLKPGDSGTESVTVANIGTLDGKLSISFSNLVDEENVVYEPELPDDETDGELAENLYLVITIDGTSVYEGCADNILTGGYDDYPLGADVSETFTVAYSIDSGVGNIIQSDIAGFDIEFVLDQAIIVESATLNYGPGGWGGWSDKEASSHGTVLNCIVKNVGTGEGDYERLIKWMPGASTDGVDYPDTPFGYTYDDSISETGYILQNDDDTDSLQLILVYPP